MQIRSTITLFLLFLLATAPAAWAQIDISLPNITGNVGDQVTIPATVGDLTGQGVLAYDVVITYDPNIIQLNAVTIDGAITPNFLLTPVPNNTTGRVVIPFAGVSNLSGAGTLFNLEGTLVGNGTSALAFERATLNEGVPAANPTNGSVVVGDGGGGGGNAFSVSPTTHNFGAVAVNSSATQAFTIRNNGTTSMSGNVSLSGSGASEFSITAGGGAYTIASGGTQVVTVAFNPITSGNKAATLVITHNVAGETSPANVALSGQGFTVGEGVSVSLPTDITGEVGQSTVVPITVGSLSGLNVVGYEFTITFDPAVVNITGNSTNGTLSSSLIVVQNTATPGQYRAVAAGATAISGEGALLNLNLSFIGEGTSGLTWSQFKFGDGDPAALTSNGNATVTNPQPTFGISPASLDFGTLPVGQSASQSVAISNTGTATMTGEVSLTGDDAGDYSITAGGGAYSLPVDGSLTVTVAFTPTAGGTRSANLSVTHNAANTTSPALAALTGVGNAGPSATDDTATTAEETAIIIPVLANDSDAEGDALSVTAVSTPSNGTAEINGNGTITYTPADNFNGNDSFTYTVSDGNNTATGNVAVTVTGSNDEPDAEDDTASTDEDTATTISVLDNDSDVDGDALSVTEVSTPANGTAEINGDGTITYKPAENFNGDDSFTYTVSDGTATASATVSVSVAAVNDAPSAVAVTNPADGTALTITGEPATVFNVQWETSADPEGDDITYTWQLSTSADFSESSIILSQDVGGQTTFETTFGILGPLLTASGVSLDASVTLFHRVVATDGTDSQAGPAAEVTLTRGSLTDIEDDTLPIDFALNQNYPNPFNPVTTISFALPSAEHVRVQVFDLLGQHIATLVDSPQAAGNHEVLFEAQDLPSGTYLYRIEAGSFRSARQLVLLK